jgi:hypothetical protein
MGDLLVESASLAANCNSVASNISLRINFQPVDP